MATSGSVDHSVSRDNILYDALNIAGATGPDDTPAATWVTHAARQLNNIYKSWEGYGVGLWARKTGYILPVSGTNQALMGPSGGAITNSYTQTTLSADAASGAASVVVTSATGISASDYIGIELTDSTMYWTTVSGAPAGTTVTLGAVLTGAASSGGYVYIYTTKSPRAIHLLNAWVHDQTADNDTPLEVVPKAIYDDLGYKASSGSANQLTYDPQLTNGVFYFYPRFSNGREVIGISYQRPFEDFDVSADTPDAPQNWYDALTMALAVRLAPVYGMPASDRQILRQEAKDALQMALDSEPEDGSLTIIPDVR